MSSLSRWVFLAQDDPRKKFKIFPEPPGNELSEHVLKILYDVCSRNGNEKMLDHLTTEEERHASLLEH
jgi:hypothetical protein